MALQGSLSELDELVGKADDDQKEVYRIGDLAREFGVTLRTLRFYEDRGLISPHREGSTRLYSRSDRARFKIILLAKQVGFSLVDIQELMAIYDQGTDLENPLGMVIGKFAEQREILKQQMSETEAAMQRLESVLSKLQQMASGNTQLQ